MCCSKEADRPTGLNDSEDGKQLIGLDFSFARDPVDEHKICVATFAYSDPVCTHRRANNKFYFFLQKPLKTFR